MTLRATSPKGTDAMAESLATTATLPAEVEAAFAALARYDRSSPRGDLVPLDEAVKRSLGKPDEMARLEERLLRVLQSDAPLPAREYVCRKLTLVGSSRCVPILAPWLEEAELADAARGVLENLPGDEAAAGLRASLGKLQGTLLAGAATSLGARRDPASVPLLSPLLRAEEAAVVAATVVALGRIGGAVATSALRAWETEAPKAMRPLLADALAESETWTGAPPN
jgi:hypothetical protein